MQLGVWVIGFVGFSDECSRHVSSKYFDRSGVGITGLFLPSVPHIFIYANGFVVKGFVGL